MPYVDEADKQLQDFYAGIGLEKSACKLCNRALWIETEYERLGCCHDCARKVGNAYYVKHTGEPSPVLASRHEWAVFEAKQKAEKRKQVISHGLRMRVFERDGFRCLRCGVQKDLRADHVVPESKGGPTTFDNLQTLCHRCNSHKSTSTTRYAAVP